VQQCEPAALDRRQRGRRGVIATAAAVVAPERLVDELANLVARVKVAR
jgi:hypothetical protein